MSVVQHADPTTPTHIYNNFTIYASTRKGKPNYLEFARPQDWGDPKKYVYRYYYYEATIADQTYAHHCHCWTDVTDLTEAQYPAFFAPCLTHMAMPGTPHAAVGRRYLEEDDFWDYDWGPCPPMFGEFSEN